MALAFLPICEPINDRTILLGNSNDDKIALPEQISNLFPTPFALPKWRNAQHADEPNSN